MLDRVICPEAFAELEQRIFTPAWGKDTFRDDPERLANGLWKEGRCVGYVYGQQVLDEVELWRIASDPDLRRQGIGSQLLTAFIEQSKQRGAIQIFLEVASGNKPAIALYERFGFKIMGRRKAYYGDGQDALNMSVRLGND